MKYLKYLLKVCWTPVRKVVGILWFWVAVQFRQYVRNTVYNYTLENGLWLKRLYERKPLRVQEGWILHSNRIETNGFVKYRKVWWIEYQIVYWLFYGWLDDDANHDVTDIGFIETITSGERVHWLGSKFIPRLEKEVEYLKTCGFGNTFELGDYRTPVELRKCWLSAFLWNLRNTSYNFKYVQYETVNKDDVFCWTILGKKFGWVLEDDDGIEDKVNYTLKFWEE